MRPTWLIRSGRSLAALILLATLVVGEVADARHHLADAGCASESAGGPERDDHCTCANLHAVSLAAAAPIAAAPLALSREFTPATPTQAPVAHAACATPPRAPPIA